VAGTEAGPLTLVEVAHLSDTGRVRHHNEDRSLAGAAVIAVADGMGGAKAGEVAAQMAVEAVAELDPPVTAADVRTAIERANAAIRQMARDDPSKSGMGTTLTAAMLGDGRLDVVHVGDSRAYLWRDGALRQLTDDHSVVAELVRRGSISPEDAESHPHRNVITRALGAEPEVVADTFSEALRDGDVVLLCSDGLSSYVAEAEIADALGGGGRLDDVAQALVERANAAGGTDNVTVVLARVGAGDAVAAEDPAQAVTVAPPAVEPQPTTEMRVLGGVHGHAGTERAGSTATARPPRVLEPVGKRRSRLRPAIVAVVVVLAALIGAAAWIASRTYSLETAPNGTVRVAHGLPFDVLGLDLSVPWQDTGLDADTVRAGRPGALSSTARGQGEAVELAAGLVWRFGLPEPPTIAAPPPPARASTPPSASSAG
jgi:serine/threonine protein phosphatase PrpC